MTIAQCLKHRLVLVFEVLHLVRPFRLKFGLAVAVKKIMLLVFSVVD